MKQKVKTEQISCLLKKKKQGVETAHFNLLYCQLDQVQD